MTWVEFLTRPLPRFSIFVSQRFEDKLLLPILLSQVLPPDMMVLAGKEEIGVPKFRA